MNPVSQFLNNMNLAKVLPIIFVTIGAGAFFFYVATRFTAPSMALLYGDLELDDSSQIISKLESLGVPYEVAGGGSQIYVPSDRVTRLRMEAAEAGLPSGGTVGYEIFDRSNGVGSSSFVQNVNRLRALEGELSRSIGTISQVKSARVHLVLPRRQLFSQTPQKPTASIAVQLMGGAELRRGEVAAIQYLVSAAVPGLTPDNVAIVDNRGRLLARGGLEGDNSSQAATSSEEMRQAYEQRIGRDIEALLERSLGPGTVRTRVSAELNFDRITTNEEIFDPDSQVVRSTQTVAETSDSKDGESGGKQVSVADELPELQPSTDDNSSTKKSSTSANRTEETVNYEISKVIKTHVRESGIVKRLSVAVLVDGTYGEPAADGTRQYQPRSKEDLDRVGALVRSAIGFDEKRGDSLEIVNMKFAALDNSGQEEVTSPLLDLDKNDIFRFGEVIILLVIAVLAILFVVRPLLTRLLDAIPKAVPPDPQMQLAGGAVDALPEPADQEDPSAMINIDQIEGKVKESSLRKVGEIIEKHPEESVSILRNWMFNEG